MRKRTVTALIAAAAIGIAITATVVHERNEPSVRFPQASVGDYQPDPAMGSLIESHFPDFYKSMPHEGDRIAEAAMLDVPGGRGAWSLLPNGKKAFSTGLTVQAIAVSDNYALVSAYDEAHQVNSVLYVIDKVTGRYRKTVVLPTQTHAGGLAVDTVTDNLYVSDDSSGKAGSAGSR